MAPDQDSSHLATFRSLEGRRRSLARSADCLDDRVRLARMGLNLAGPRHDADRHATRHERNQP